MSLVLDILKNMYDAELNYKGVKVNAFGIPTSFIAKNKSHRDTLYRLSREGYIKKGDNGWQMTPRGRRKVEDKLPNLKSFKSPFSNQVNRDLLLIFDIPESQKVKREWLRMHLKEFNYKLVQRSVWVGPSPLPKDFIKYLKFIRIEKCIKTFKLAKSKGYKS